jgi:hypothetical protein
MSVSAWSWAARGGLSCEEARTLLQRWARFVLEVEDLLGPPIDEPRRRAFRCGCGATVPAGMPRATRCNLPEDPTWARFLAVCPDCLTKEQRGGVSLAAWVRRELDARASEVSPERVYREAIEQIGRIGKPARPPSRETKATAKPETGARPWRRPRGTEIAPQNGPE